MHSKYHLKYVWLPLSDSVFSPDCSDRTVEMQPSFVKEHWQWKTDLAQGLLMSAKFSSVGTVLTRN